MPPSATERPDRLRRSADFSRAQGQGRRQRGRLLTVVASSGPEPRSRVGFAVSRKVGNAVVRNRVKRWLREAVHAAPQFVPSGADVVIIAHPSAAAAGLLALSTELAALLTRLSR